MIKISQLRNFMESLVADLPGLTGAALLAIEANMAKKIGAYSEGDTVLFYLAPSAEGKMKNYDAYSEKNMMVLFVMRKYSPLKTSVDSVLEEHQQVLEEVKEMILELGRYGCSFMKPDLSSVSILPETDLFANWVGWSLAFQAE